MPTKEITPRQKELLSVIYEYIRDTGYPPSFEEMREGLGVSSNQSVLDLLKKLEAGELIRRSEGARSLAILPLGYQALGQQPLLQVSGITSAGMPIEAIGRYGEWQQISSEVARLADEVFLLKISGDSMINAGINDGDVVLVKNEKEFYSGDIVLTQIQDDSTIKRFISDDRPPFVYLKPENPKYDVIPFTEEMRMIGKVLSVMRSGSWKPIR